MDKDTLIKQIKQHRKDLDALLQEIRKTAAIIGREAGGREVALSITNLQQSILWLGMVLKEINPENNPYPQSYNPENAVVAPTADGLKL